MFDLLITHGRIVDGQGSPAFRGSVGILGDRIVYVGDAAAEACPARETLDARGQIVCPGLIDMHSHADFSLFKRSSASLYRQGVTTAVVGQCGESPSPLLPATRREVLSNYNSLEEAELWSNWSSLGTYLDFLMKLGQSINLVPLVGQGTIRAGVMGYGAEPPTAAQLDAMCAQVAEAMAQGAFGISTGLIYPPGSFAGTEELIALASVAARHGGFYFSHIRGEGGTLLEAVSEAIRIGRESGARVQISHHKACWPRNWPLQEQALALIDAARREGLDVCADVYPYLAASTGLTNNLPEWAHQGGKPGILRRLADPVERRRMAQEMRETWDGSWDKVMICRSPGERSLEGRLVADLAREAGLSGEEWVFDALLRTDLDLSVVLFLLSEDNVIRVLRKPYVTIGSDSYTCAAEAGDAGQPHPRTFGTFPRVLGRYVRELRALGLEEAIRKMTGLAADRLGLSDRGRIRRDCMADLLVFDPELVKDMATFERPLQYPEGITHVLCNGQFLVRDGVDCLQRPGRVLPGPGVPRN